ncbi:hypothetical protein ACOME3_007974 [Neoechinorhynchus agilis]
MSSCNVINHRSNTGVLSPSFTSPCLVEYRTSFYDNVPVKGENFGFVHGTHRVVSEPLEWQKVQSVQAEHKCVQRRKTTLKPHLKSYTLSSMSSIQIEVLKTRACCELNSILMSQSGISADFKILENCVSEHVVEHINRQLRSILSASVNHLSSTLWSVTRLYDDQSRRNLRNYVSSGKRRTTLRRNRRSDSLNISSCRDFTALNKRQHSRHQNIFNKSLISITREWGHPLPQVILDAMEFLIKESKTAIGIFRKPGLKSRIERLCTSLEYSGRIDSSSGHRVIERTVSEPNHPLSECEENNEQTPQSPYDVADLCKRFFRELPEPLLTRRLSSLFLKIESDKLVNYKKLYAMQMALILLPDENRITFITLLWFLHEISKESSQHQMTIPNLSTCFAPTIFSFSEQNSLFVNANRQNLSDGFKEVEEQKLGVLCLTFLISNCKQLSLVPQHLLKRCSFKCSQWTSPCSLTELKSRFSDTLDSCPRFVDRCIDELVKESQNKGRKWTSCSRSSTRQARVFLRKLNDGCPLPLWKVTTEISASPDKILDLILYKRKFWDDDYLEGAVLRKLAPDAEIFAYSQRNIAPHPCRQFTEFRCRRSGIKSNEGHHAVVCTSISVDKRERGEYRSSENEQDEVEAVTMAARFLIRPIDKDRSHLSYLSRVDFRGYSPQWYWKCFGFTLQRQVAKIRDSFAG